MEKSEKLIKYLERLSSFTLPSWDKIPDLDLYMDQTITYIERELAPLMVDANKEKYITASMINNYVKNGVIKAPQGKKYNKEHLCEIFLICCMKQVLAISDIGQLFGLYNDTSQAINETYEYLRSMQKEKIVNITKEMLKELKAQDKEELAVLSFKLALEASIKKTIASYIISIINEPSQSEQISEKQVKEKQAKAKKEKNDSKQV